MTKIIIVAGGLATRMKPITEDIPKCLVDINGKPLIQHQLEFLRDRGYKDIIFCVAHLADMVKDYFKDGKEFGLNIEYVQETKELMGTAGSVKLTQGLIGDDENFIVYYGDNLTNMDFDSFLKYHREKGGIATICVRPLQAGYKSSSIITLDENNKIKVFLEKPPEEEFEKYKDRKRFVNNGIYAFKREVLDLIPEGEKYDFAKQLFPKIMKEDQGIFGYVAMTDFFREIGRVEKYKMFLDEFKEQDIFRRRKAIFMDRDGVINPNVKRLCKAEQFELIAGVAEAIKKINDNSYLAIIVTNQPNISKGFCSFDDMRYIHDKMTDLLEKEGAHIDAIYMCPHHPEKGFDGEVKELKIDCDCRKPKPGLIFQAMRDLNIDVSDSWMIGDSMTDIIAGEKAGCKTVFLTSGGGSGAKQEKEYVDVEPDFVKNDLLDAIKFIFSTKD